MNYIYNILACLDKRCLDTFEWSNNEIVSINKTLLFRFDDATFLLNNNVIVSKDFLNKIKGKTKGNRYIKYGCMLSNYDIAIFCVFDEDGNIIYKSKMLYNEEQEAICISNTQNNLENFIVSDSSDSYNYLLTVDENEKETFVRGELDRLLDRQLYDKIEYLYFECFGNNKKYNEDILNEINKNFYVILDKAYDFLFETSIINK